MIAGENPAHDTYGTLLCWYGPQAFNLGFRGSIPLRVTIFIWSYYLFCRTIFIRYAAPSEPYPFAMSPSKVADYVHPVDGASIGVTTLPLFY